MKTINTLFYGNHPKTGKLKERTKKIIKIIKENNGKINAIELEKKLGISRVESPSMFYKPLAAMKKWDLIQSHKTVNFDDKGKKHFKTEYELTPVFFYRYVEKTLTEMVKKEIELI